MKYVKLSLLEAAFLADTLEALRGDCDYVETDRLQGLELLEENINSAAEEQIPSECKNI